MNGSPFLKNEQAEAARLKRRYVPTVITLNGNTTPANITASTDMPGFVDVALTTTAANTLDAGALFDSLAQTAAPATVGIITRSGDTKAAVATRVSVISSVSMTAGVVTRYGAGSTGVTASANGSLKLSCTGLDLDAQTATHTILFEQWFDSF